MKQLLILLFIHFSSSYTVCAQDISVEPPSWWHGLAVDTVQLMLFGDNINHLKASLDQQISAEITNITTSNNSDYLWITLDLSNLNSETTLQIDLIDGAKIVYQFQYAIESPLEPYSNGFDQSDAIYLITPDRFANGDTSNDDIAGYHERSDRADPDGKHGGDLEGIQRYLDYIIDMGFTAIWLNPIVENDNPKYSYHGYGATDFYKVDLRYGTNAEYKTFVKICHSKGLKVIMDMIHNHCSDNHPWLANRPTPDWVNQWEDYTQTNHKKSTLQDIHAAEIDKKTYTDGWFVPVMPDLNQRNPLLSTYLIQNAIWWSLYLDLDGIRMDTYSYPDKAYMKLWVERMATVVPDVSIVGEEWSTNPAHIAYWQKGKVNPDGYQSDLEYLMDFPTNQVLSQALTEQENWNTGIGKLYESISNDFQYPSPENLLIFPDNHDMVRVYTRLGEDLDMMKAATIFCLTTRGIPQIYYGTEILMTSPVDRQDGKIRSDYPGGWKGDTVNAFTGVGLYDDQIAFKNFLSKLLTWRKTKSVLHSGQLLHYVPRDGLYVYFRYDERDKVMVIINKNAKRYELDLRRFDEMLGKESRNGTSILTNERVKLDGSITLRPRESYVIEID